MKADTAPAKVPRAALHMAGARDVLQNGLNSHNLGIKLSQFPQFWYNVVSILTILEQRCHNLKAVSIITILVQRCLNSHNFGTTLSQC